MNDKRKCFGQYFTINKQLLEKVYRFIRNTEGLILEPSFGQGHIIKYLKEKEVCRPFIGIEIDETLESLEGIQDITTIIHQDFLKYNTEQKFNTIVGNPPYFKLKNNPNPNTILKTSNVYVAFIEKAYELLSDNGELIFIIPSDFFKLTSARKLKDLLMMNGSFTDVYHPHDEHLFDKATQDVMIFRYQKGVKQNYTVYNESIMNIIINQGNIYFRDIDDNQKQVSISDVFDIKVGMVSGAEGIFNNSDLGNVEIFTSNGCKKEILITELSKCSQQVISYLTNNKQELMKRQIRQFNDENWFQWGCLRNIKFMKEKKDETCLYAKVLTRSDDVFMMGTVQLYDGSLLCMYPKMKLTYQQLENIKVFLNTRDFLKNFMYSGRYKLGQKTLSNCFIPRYLVCDQE